MRILALVLWTLHSVALFICGSLLLFVACFERTDYWLMGLGLAMIAGGALLLIYVAKEIWSVFFYRHFFSRFHKDYSYPVRPSWEE